MRTFECLAGMGLFLAVSAQPVKFLRVGFGDNRTIPGDLLGAEDLVCAPEMGKSANEPQIRITKFTDTSKMTEAELAKRKKAGFNWICYDNENGKDWPTPAEEQADPTKYTLLAAKKAHDAGFKFMVEPGFELIVGRGTRGKDGKIELTDKHVPAVKMKEVAPSLDAVSLQFQRAQGDLDAYREFTKKYVAEIREANPKTIVFVQVTSREKAGRTMTAAELMANVRTAADVVDGIWIHVEKGQDAFAREMVNAMAKEGYRSAATK